MTTDTIRCKARSSWEDFLEKDFFDFLPNWQILFDKMLMDAKKPDVNPIKLKNLKNVWTKLLFL